MLAHMSLSQLRAAAKTAGLPTSGNKSMLAARLGSSTSNASDQSSVRQSPGLGKTTQPIRVPMQFDAAMLKTLNLRLTGVSTDASGQPEYIYMPCNASPGPIASISKHSTKKTLGTIAKSKTGGNAQVSDEALDEAIGCFVERLDEKKVPVELCRQMLKHFVDEKEIPKQKTKVYELLAEQSHLETDDEASDDEEDDDDCEDSDAEDEDDCEDGA